MRAAGIPLAVILLFACVGAFSQPPGYYNGTENLTGTALKSALNDIIQDHVDFSYYRSKNIINMTDSDPDNPDHVILFYLQESRDASLYGQGGDYINREHVWAKSHGNFTDDRPMDGDVHNLRPADASVNEARGNKDFDNVQPYGFQHSEALECWYNDDAWEPGPATKGQVARILFYMAVRYEGEFEEIDLEVVDKLDTYPLPEHGKLSTLLDWNNQYPPSDFERRRNERIYQVQQNRNPFVDNPDFANRIWREMPPKPVQFAHLEMVPKKPGVGGSATFSVQVISETAPDQVMVFWGDSFNSRQYSAPMTQHEGTFTASVLFDKQQPGETVYFTIGAYQATDSSFVRGSYLFPEKISQEEITPISEVQGTGTVSPLLGKQVTIAGRITANFDNTSYVQDASSVRGGICVFNALQTGHIGDSVVVRGIVAEYANLTELTEVVYFYNYGDRKKVNPVLIDTGLLNEAYEGMLVRLENVTFANGGATIQNGNNVYSFSDDAGQGVLFSERDGRLPGKKLPSGRTTITGVLSQYHDNYQLLPRSVTDLSAPTYTGPAITPLPVVDVYPNPATDRLYIKSNGNIRSVAVCTLNGGYCQKGSGDMRMLDISTLSPGIYVLHIVTDQDRTIYKKIVVI